MVIFEEKLCEDGKPYIFPSSCPETKDEVLASLEALKKYEREGKPIVLTEEYIDKLEELLKS